MNLTIIIPAILCMLFLALSYTLSSERFGVGRRTISDYFCTIGLWFGVFVFVIAILEAL